METTNSSSAVPQKQMEIIPDGSLRLSMGDGTFMQCHVEWLRNVLNRAPEAESEIISLRTCLHYSRPNEFVPKMIADLEAKAERSDKAGTDAAAAAYSDAARVLRKALK